MQQITQPASAQILTPQSRWTFRNGPEDSPRVKNTGTRTHTLAHNTAALSGACRLRPRPRDFSLPSSNKTDSSLLFTAAWSGNERINGTNVSSSCQTVGNTNTNTGSSRLVCDAQNETTDLGRTEEKKKEKWLFFFFCWWSSSHRMLLVLLFHYLTLFSFCCCFFFVTASSCSHSLINDF